MTTLTPQPWQYLVVRRTSHNDSPAKEQAFLDGYGSDNWVLCEVRPQKITGALWYYFRKPA